MIQMIYKHNRSVILKSLKTKYVKSYYSVETVLHKRDSKAKITNWKPAEWLKKKQKKLAGFSMWDLSPLILYIWCI